jgi:hypothetical protein
VNKEELPVNDVSVRIEGCVNRPGIYEIPQGATLHYALRKARPKVLADLSGIPVDELVLESRVVTVPQRQEIRVKIHGGVRNGGEFVLPAGTRFFELKEILDLEEGVGRLFLKSRRTLKDGEEIFISP